MKGCAVFNHASPAGNSGAGVLPAYERSDDVSLSSPGVCVVVTGAVVGKETLGVGLGDGDELQADRVSTMTSIEIKVFRIRGPWLFLLFTNVDT